MMGKRLVDERWVGMEGSEERKNTNGTGTKRRG
jgi:hypothetical protein